MESAESKFELPDDTPLSEIVPIEEGGVSVQTREDLKYFVEPPLLEACQLFFDKGVKTVFSSANKKDIDGGYAYIALDFDSLSPANKEVALSLGEEGVIHGAKPKKGIYLKIPVTVSSTLGDIKKQALDLVSRFENQN